MNENFVPRFDPVDHPETTPAARYRPLKDNMYVLGLVLIALASLVFATGEFVPGIFTESFFIIFALVWIYTISLWANKRIRWWLFGARQADTPVMLLYLTLWLVSCFALNREVSIFQESASWLSGHLLVSAGALLAYAWRAYWPRWGQIMLYFVLGATGVLILYYTVALINISILGLIFFWFFFVPVHALIPLVILVYIIKILFADLFEDQRLLGPSVAGIGAPLVVLTVFCWSWTNLNEQARTGIRNWEMASVKELPRWVAVSQQLDRGVLTGRLLKLVGEGTIRSNTWEDTFFPNFNTARENDPLLQVASRLSDTPNLRPEECRKIYAAQFDGRHAMEERLWSGNDLITTDVHTTVMLDPGHRLSYTEKVLTVAQGGGSSGGATTQEAIYTFYLPEGGVATALSLWIDGVEEPGVLTSRSKATEAYKTIVGRERRDPALVTWQEGNTVRVRVFPVTPELPRRFKIGVTAPLRHESELLEYESISFDGPRALMALERDSVYFKGQGVLENEPDFFDRTASGNALVYKGLYHHNWSLACRATPLSRSAFSFEGHTYSVAAGQRERESFVPEVIYADLNKGWTASEWAALRALAADRELFVFEDGYPVRVRDDNATGLLRRARGKRFSLFPFYAIPIPEKALVITKSTHPAPGPADLEGSPFSENLKNMRACGIRLYDLEARANTFLRALAESRLIFRAAGDMDNLKNLLQSNQYYKNPESEGVVVIPAADMVLVEKAQENPGGEATDHLFRLFAYNKIMRETGVRNEETPELLRLAEQAWVVTPLSSLVTLETQADYDRFDIKPTEGLNSLGSASKSGSGAVPEPHEWALIFLLTVAAFWIWKRG